MRFMNGYRALATGLVLAGGISATTVDVLPDRSQVLGHAVDSSFKPEFSGVPVGGFESLDSSNLDHGLVARQDEFPAKIAGNTYCGQFHVGDRRNAHELIEKIPQEMPYKEWSNNFTMPAKTCTRVKCWNTSGLYMCNPTRRNITVETVSQMRRALRMANKCCTSAKYINRWHFGSSGEFRDDAGWSAISAYANCRSPPVTYWPSKAIPSRSDPKTERCYWKPDTTTYGDLPVIPEIEDE